ncbi:MAG: sigma-54-dependent Fis family transcriptional regulator [Acidobacteria bacterium]|nr:sigma-54-dependent Fis family transcriptional regulator [Acidobacteriota bacterium]
MVVDSDESSRERVAEILRRDHRVLRAGSAEAGLGLIGKDGVDVVLADRALPGVSGFDFLRIVRENYPLAEFVMLADDPDVDAAVAAIKLGAYHFLVKSASPEAVQSIVAHASARQDLNRKVMALSDEVRDQSGDREFVSGPSPAIREVLESVHKVATLSATVLIQGESGTGKELVARMLHRHSEFPDGPFVAVNLAAIPRELVESTLFGHEKGAFTGAVRQQIGKFELAHGGTLFLDEIGELKVDLQAKLLRAIQEGEIERVGGGKPLKVQFRLVSATNVDLERAVKDGSFREDLYYRIRVIPIRVPPLRERGDDLAELVKFFLTRYNTRFRKNVQGISTSTLQMLQHYWWPGNIRELENLIERLVATCDHDWITDGDLPLELQVADADRGGTTNLLDRALSIFERNYIIRALERSRWNVTQTAKYLGIPLSTLKFKLDRLEIKELARRVRGGA